MSVPEVTIRLDDAEKIVELLSGFSLLLRSSLPQRQFDLLQSELDQSGVYEPLRYDIPIGPQYVADEADAVLRRLREQLPKAD